MSLWDGFKEFYAQPWRGAQNMSATDWFLIFGMFLIIAAGWRIIFRHIEIE